MTLRDWLHGGRQARLRAAALARTAVVEAQRADHDADLEARRRAAALERQARFDRIGLPRYISPTPDPLGDTHGQD
jgi:hypothetical protein